jgi:4-amino-4-deoxy-L-arabinose transferase-like glycosyltransferase
MVGTSILLAFRTPTFDFDEALYRRLAEEMKASHQYFAMTWDGRPFYEKPPTYVWTIVASSRLLDGPSPSVSLLASRLPSLLFSTLTLILLSLFWHRYGRVYAVGFGGSVHAPQRAGLSALLPPVAFGTALFPMAQATSVLLDPMLTFFLTIVLLILTAALQRRTGAEVRLTAKETVTAAIAMAGAMAVKGLLGIILPAIAIITHEILSMLCSAEARPRVRPFWHRLRGVAAGVARSFGLALIFAGAIYTFFYRMMGRAFLTEFLIRQHFVRGTRPLQGHSGSLFYYVILLFAAGPAVVFVCAAIATGRRSRLPFAQWGFPLSWSAALIVFISLLATKLPNYTWPAWPAIALSLCILVMRASAHASEDQNRSARIGWLRVSIAAIGIAAASTLSIVTLALSCGLDIYIGRFMTTLRARTILMSVEPLPLQVRIGLGLIAIAFALQIVEQCVFVRNIAADAAAVWRTVAGAAALNCVVLVIASLAVVPYFDRQLREPLVRVSHVASGQHLIGGDLTTIALFSPTVSSNYDRGPVRQIGVHGPFTQAAALQHLVITPVWESAACRRRGFVLTDADAYLLLCKSELRFK